MSEMHVVVTGGAGRVGKTLRKAMSAEFRKVTVLDLVAETDLAENEVASVCDIVDLAALTGALEGADALIHLAGYPIDQAIEDILRVNCQGTWNLYEAARQQGIGRVVQASSNHATGFYRRDQRVSPDMPMRPDGSYGLSKCFGELVAGLYWDKAGIRTLSLRIGNAMDRPSHRRGLVTWISPRDLAQQVRIGLTHPDIDATVIYGVSACEDGWWDNSVATALGYVPQDRIEDFATPDAWTSPLETEVAETFQGGMFCSVNHDGVIRGRADLLSKSNSDHD
nr:NAD(P)-dependent oxidoreductase [Frigidibacter sp. ROC022]